MEHSKDPELTDEQNKALEKEIAELIAVGVPEWQARETASINLGIVKGDAIALKDPDVSGPDSE